MVRLSDLDGPARAKVRALLAAEQGASRARRPTAPRSAPRAAPRPSGAPDAPTGPLVFVLPMPPNVLNRASRASTNGRVVAREKRAYLATLDEMQAAGLIPPPPPHPFMRATVRADMALWNAMDEDNATARAFKWPSDFLVSRGYLASDRRTCLTRDGYPTQRVTRKEPASLTLTLTPLVP